MSGTAVQHIKIIDVSILFELIVIDILAEVQDRVHDLEADRKNEELVSVW